MNIAVAAANHDNATTISEPFEREGEPGAWSIEEIGSDGEIYQAIFTGPMAEDRAREYWAFKYGR